MNTSIRFALLVLINLILVSAYDTYDTYRNQLGPWEKRSLTCPGNGKVISAKCNFDCSILRISPTEMVVRNNHDYTNNFSYECENTYSGPNAPPP